MKPRVDEWRRHAACLGADPELFFPPPGSKNPIAIQQYCLLCLVQAECLETGLGERFGIWGGKTPVQRRAIRKEQANPPKNYLGINILLINS